MDHTVAARELANQPPADPTPAAEAIERIMLRRCRHSGEMARELVARWDRNREAKRMTEYIANCIWTILEAPCHVSKECQRMREIAEAFDMAATNGVKAAHAHLLSLSKQAKSGRYTKRNLC